MKVLGLCSTEVLLLTRVVLFCCFTSFGKPWVPVGGLENSPLTTLADSPTVPLTLWPLTGTLTNAEKLFLPPALPLFRELKASRSTPLPPLRPTQIISECYLCHWSLPLKGYYEVSHGIFTIYILWKNELQRSCVILWQMCFAICPRTPVFLPPPPPVEDLKIKLLFSEKKSNLARRCHHFCCSNLMQDLQWGCWFRGHVEGFLPLSTIMITTFNLLF